MPFAKIPDGHAHTIMILEVNDSSSVAWTRPEDFRFDVDSPMAELGAAHSGGFHIATADASVRFIDAPTFDAQVFLSLLLLADGKLTPAP